MLSESRQEVYQRLESKIGNTPLLEIHLPHGHRFFAKAEYKNPSRSHYDRVYIRLLREIEDQGKIVPGATPLIETSSGNAGASFAWLSKELGYEATVIVPPELPSKRVEDISQYGASVRFSKPGEYVGGASRELRRVLTEENRERKAKGLPKFWSPNHSQDMRSAEALEGIADEALDTLDDLCIKIDYFIGAIGNGASLLGPARVIKERSPDTRVLAWEPLASGAAYEMRKPGDYLERFHLEPGTLSHTVFGTGVGDVDFPMLKHAIMGNGGPSVVDKVVLMNDEDTVLQFYEKFNLDRRILHGLNLSPGSGNSRISQEALDFVRVLRSKPFWDRSLPKLHDMGLEVGRSSAGSFAIAERMARKDGGSIKLKKNFPFLEEVPPEPKVFLGIFYDPISKY